MNGGRNFVDVLTAVTASAAGSNSNIFHFEIDFFGINLGHNSDRSGGSLNSTSFFGNWDSLNSMSARFMFKLIVGIVAGDFDDMIVDLTDFPTNFVGITDVHIHKVISPDRGFLTTGSRIKFHDSNIGVNSRHILDNRS